MIVVNELIILRGHMGVFSQKKKLRTAVFRNGYEWNPLKRCRHWDGVIFVLTIERPNSHNSCRKKLFVFLSFALIVITKEKIVCIILLFSANSLCRARCFPTSKTLL